VDSCVRNHQLTSRYSFASYATSNDHTSADGTVSDKSPSLSSPPSSSPGDESNEYLSSDEEYEQITARDKDMTVLAAKSWEIKAVGFIESPYLKRYGTPKQATISRHEGGAREGRVRLLPGFEECIDKLDGFDYIWVLTLMHRNSGFKKKIKPQVRM
jgi:hypothetical protein